MYSYLLQDWITLRVNSGQPSLTQSESDWMSFQAYQDIILWLDVRSVVLASATDVLIAFETAPAKDESLFLPMRPAVSLANAVSGVPIVVPVILSQITSPDVPLARWVRWKLLVSGGPPSDDWGATVRVHCSANAVGVL